MNRVNVMLKTGAGVGPVEQVLQRQGVPLEALDFEVTGAIIAAEVVSDRIRPLRGGTFISTRDAIGCSYGFNARDGADTIMITASHCTKDIYGASPKDSVWQHDTLSAANYLGAEKADPSSFTCGWLGYNCRNSDAASFVVNPDSVVFQIARTMYSDTGMAPAAGSTTIDPSNKFWRVVGYWNQPPEGAGLDKMGVTNGWMFGEVEQTCNTVTATDTVGVDETYRIKCASRMDAQSYGGDSGGPVFHRLQTAGWVTLAGLVFGVTEGGTWFSPFGQIREDFPGIQVHEILPPPGGSFNVTISGPDLAPEHAYETCSWNANVTGQTGSVTYMWEYDGTYVGSGSAWWGDTGEEDLHVLKVTAWDNNGADTYEMEVVVEGSGWECD
jgi:hypothetical protein